MLEMTKISDSAKDIARAQLARFREPLLPDRLVGALLVGLLAGAPCAVVHVLHVASGGHARTALESHAS